MPNALIGEKPEPTVAISKRAFGFVYGKQCNAYLPLLGVIFTLKSIYKLLNAANIA